MKTNTISVNSRWATLGSCLYISKDVFATFDEQARSASSDFCLTKSNLWEVKPGFITVRAVRKLCYNVHMSLTSNGILLEVWVLTEIILFFSEFLKIATSWSSFFRIKGGTDDSQEERRCWLYRRSRQSKAQKIQHCCHQQTRKTNQESHIHRNSSKGTTERCYSDPIYTLTSLGGR